MRTLGEGAQVVAEHYHDALYLFPVNSTRAVIGEGTPHVAGQVFAEVVDAGAGVGVDRAGTSGCWLDGAAVEDL